MSLWSRIMLLFQAKSHAALDRAEDPREMLDYGYTQQQELLRKVKQGLIEVSTSKAQLQQQVEKLRTRIPQLEEQARRAVALERTDLARAALERKQTALAELAGLGQQVGVVAQEEEKLTRAVQQLSARIEEFRTRRTVMSARYSAAEAKIRVSESLSGVSNELADLSMALGRAEEKTERLQARAAALDTLIEGESLAMNGQSGDRVEQELRVFITKQTVEQELAALTAELQAGNARAAIASQSEGSHTSFRTE